MATYDEIHGKRIKEFSDDPTLNSSYEGQVWYNSTSGQLKSVVSFAAWASGPNVSTARINGSASGIQTAAVYAGGNAPPYSTATEEYNGTGFENGGNMNDNRDPYSGFGTLTDTVTAGGYDGSNKAESETYNGTSWSEGNNLNTARRGQQGFGTSGDAGVCCGGYESSASTATEEYDGSSWTTVTAMPTARYSGCATGAQSSGIQVGGDPGSVSTSFEYDGTNWSSGGALSTGRSFIMLGGATQDAVIAFGGETSPGAITTGSENYDGTSWTTGTSSGTGHKNISCGGWGTKTATFAAFGNGPPGSQISTTEEYNISVNNVTPAAWSSGGSLNLGRHNNGNSGTQTAGLTFGGKVYPNVFKNESEEYNGTSWSEGNNLGTARMIAGSGTQTAGLGFGGTNGAPGSTGVQALTEEYNGTSWSESGDMATARMGLGGAGLQTATYAAGGIGSPNSLNDLHEQYNGSTWSTATAMNTERSNMGSVGTTGAGLVFAGYVPPSYAFATSSEEWTGSAWTSGGTLNTARADLGGFGSQTDAIAFGGATPPNSPSALAEGYDGTAFSTRPSMAQARGQFAPSGSYNSGSDGMAVGGSNAGNPVFANTEEWTPETQTVAASSLASS